MFRHARNAATTLIVGLLAAVIVSWGCAAPALAHDQLISSSPGAGQKLDSSPDSVTLQFSAAVQTIGAELRLTSASGTPHALGAAKFNGEEITAKITQALPDSEYTLAWRVVSSDGHPISGVVRFTVGDAQAHTSPATSRSEQVAISETPASDATANDQQANAARDEYSRQSWIRPVVVVIVGAVVAFGIFAFVTRSRKRKTND